MGGGGEGNVDPSVEEGSNVVLVIISFSWVQAEKA
jgi:hypothetical protein